ncbi:MAG: response regulator [Sneathiella sp.]|nr:response regulator [Sneathiella sp.]
MKDQQQPLIIIEDSDDDYEAIYRALRRKSELTNPLIRFENGDNLVEYLNTEYPGAELKSNQLPALILLDLNLPGKPGHKILDELKKDPKFKIIPVVILSTSSDNRDIDICYEKGANSFIVKPVDIEKFTASLQFLKEYWFDISVLPKQIKLGI